MSEGVVAIEERQPAGAAADCDHEICGDQEQRRRDRYADREIDDARIRARLERAWEVPCKQPRERGCERVDRDGPRQPNRVRGSFGQRQCERATRRMREEHGDQQEQPTQVRQADVASCALQQIECECAEQHDFHRTLPIADDGGLCPLDPHRDRDEARQSQRDLQQREEADQLQSRSSGQVGREPRTQAARHSRWSPGIPFSSVSSFAIQTISGANRFAPDSIARRAASLTQNSASRACCITRAQ